MDTADHSEADRSHNRDTLSSEAMTEMLRDIQDAMLALDERLVTLETSQEGASVDTRRLALGVADMGDALKRRMRALEQVRQDPLLIQTPGERAPPISPPRPPPQRRLPWIAALVFALVVVLGGFWLMAAESLDHASPTAPTRPTIVTAPVPVPAPAVANTTPIIPPPLIHTPSHPATTAHRWTPFRKTYAHTNPASQSTSTATGFGHYGPTPSAPAPATNAAPSHPPS